jgi:hypothetical protein
MRTRRFALSAGLGLSLLGWTLGGLPSCCATAAAQSQAGAPQSAPSEVLIVLGRSEGSEVDPALLPLKALHKAPFDAFPTKALLQRAEVRLEAGKDTEVALPNGRTLHLTLTEALTDGRLRLKVSVGRSGERDYLPLMTVTAAPGDPFFIAGQKYAGGTLILGVRVLKRH